MKYFNVSRIIHARHFQTGCNIKPKPWQQVLGPGPGFLILNLWFKSWVLGSGIAVSDPRVLVCDPHLKSQISDSKSRILVYSIIITKCDKKYKVWQVLQDASDITKCERKLLQRVIGIMNCDRC